MITANVICIIYYIIDLSVRAILIVPTGDRVSTHNRSVSFKEWLSEQTMPSWWTLLVSICDHYNEYFYQPILCVRQPVFLWYPYPWLYQEQNDNDPTGNKSHTTHESIFAFWQNPLKLRDWMLTNQLHAVRWKNIPQQWSSMRLSSTAIDDTSSSITHHTPPTSGSENMWLSTWEGMIACCLWPRSERSDGLAMWSELRVPGKHHSTGYYWRNKETRAPQNDLDGWH